MPRHCSTGGEQSGLAPAGQRLIEAWRRARIIIDRGGNPSAADPAKPNVGTAPAAPKPA